MVPSRSWLACALVVAALLASAHAQPIVMTCNQGYSNQAYATSCYECNCVSSFLQLSSSCASTPLVSVLVF
jgi:hypothetical protein